MTMIRRSSITGRRIAREIPISPEDYLAWVNANPQPPLRDAFPHLTAEEAEFIEMGWTDADWTEMFSVEP